MSVTDDNLGKMLSVNGVKLFSLCEYAVGAVSPDDILNRKFLGLYNLEARWAEETLDWHGAVHNTKWFSFREAVAIGKIFSVACFDLLHLEKAAPYYDLLKIDDNFSEDIEKYLDVFFNLLVDISGEILKQSVIHKLDPHLEKLESSLFRESELPGKLEYNRKKRRGKDIRHKVIYLATAFLNLSPEFHIIEAVRCVKANEIKGCIPDHISEENLRQLKARFHNLQSTYDTYLYKTDLEKEDNDLLVLRGHISIIFHLLHSATELSHYYERHILNMDHHIFKKPFIPIQEEKILDMIINFFIKYIDQYFAAAKNLCKSIIKQYAEIGEIDLPIPEYRGFHVRPSTLIAKIVLHYGSRVTMIIDNESYDASNPLELFRVNEKINSVKRKYINEFIAPGSKLDELTMSNLDQWPRIIQLVMLDLMNSGKIILYEKNLSLEGITPEEDETPGEFFKRLLFIFLASGKIDIHSDIHVHFSGDERVLADLKILAENGYGEDKYGNNIMLPKELPYLKR